MNNDKKREKKYFCFWQENSLSPVILYSWLDGLALILKFFRVLLACWKQLNKNSIAEIKNQWNNTM